MKIVKFQPDEEGMIYIKNCVRLLTMGLQKNIVTIWAVTDATAQSIPMVFSVKGDGEQVTATDCNHYVNSFINDQVILHLFGEEPKIAVQKGKVLT